MDMYDILNKKKRGKVLSTDEIRYFVDGYTNGDIPDYQASALMMAICLNGLDERETADLTFAMMNSGEVFSHSFPTFTADKHSTGGVGDKTTLIIAPIVASCGVLMPKMSGRGLGHTGGTIDKLESIPGFRTELSHDEFVGVVERAGFSVISQSGEICPADKKIYALRDSTATVDSIPLIASSVMSKKLAMGADCIVLDVKAGSGAFMKTPESAKELAAAMLSIGKAAGKRCRALITDMDIPLGAAVGNSLEVIEAIELLKGNAGGALREVSVALAAAILESAGKGDMALCTDMANRAIDSGSALERLCLMIEAQGGDPGVIDDYSRFPQAAVVYEVRSLGEGYISAIDSEECGLVSVNLGGGRIKKDDAIDHSAGVLFKKSYGDYVTQGETLALLYTNNGDISAATSRLLSAIRLSSEPPASRAAVIDIL